MAFLLYNIEDLKKYLEDQFENWMNWGKYTSWNIDYIIPSSFFKYKSKKEEFCKCWALSNLRPLSAKANIIDGNKRPFNLRIQ